MYSILMVNLSLNRFNPFCKGFDNVLCRYTPLFKSLPWKLSPGKFDEMIFECYITKIIECYIIEIGGYNDFRMFLYKSFGQISLSALD